MRLNKRQQLKRAYFTFEWRRKYDATNWQRIMVLSFTCFLILVAVPLNLLGLSGPTGILFTALNLGQYAFTIGALSLLAFRVVKLRDEIERIGNEEKAALNRISEAIPGLTPSEVEIVQLILHGHKTSEICMMLGKEKGNITSQRTHIRAKLGLTDPRADLRSALIERIERQAQ